MSRRTKAISHMDAKAYKTRSEGQAALVIAWTPVIITVIVLAAVFIAPSLGIDLVPYMSGIPSLIETKIP